MIRTLNSENWEHGNAGKGTELTYDLPVRPVVEVEFRSRNEAELSAVTSEGETVFLDSGRIFHYRGRLDGFKGLVLKAVGSYSVRAVCVSSAEVLDPTRMVNISIPVENPEREAMKQMLAEHLAKLQTEKLLATDEDVYELADDLVNGDLEFEEPDDWGLTAAAELEEEEAHERAVKRMREEQAEEAEDGDADAVPPGKQKTAPGGAVPAEAAGEAST